MSKDKIDCKRGCTFILVVIIRSSECKHSQRNFTLTSIVNMFIITIDQNTASGSFVVVNPEQSSVFLSLSAHCFGFTAQIFIVFFHSRHCHHQVHTNNDYLWKRNSGAFHNQQRTRFPPKSWWRKKLKLKQLIA